MPPTKNKKRKFISMLKVLAAVLAVLSAVISITLYSTTIPAIQKQAEDNAEAIEQLQNGGGGSGGGGSNLYLHTFQYSGFHSITFEMYMLSFYSEAYTQTKFNYDISNNLFIYCKTKEPGQLDYTGEYITFGVTSNTTLVFYKIGNLSDTLDVELSDMNLQNDTVVKI